MCHHMHRLVFSIRGIEVTGGERHRVGEVDEFPQAQQHKASRVHQVYLAVCEDFNCQMAHCWVSLLKSFGPVYMVADYLLCQLH